MAYGVLAESEWNADGIDWKIELLEDGYASSILPLNLMEILIKIGNSESDVQGIMSPIVRSNCQISFMDLNTTIALRIVGAAQKQFKVIIYDVTAGSVFWTGFILPFSLEYDPYWTHTEIKLTATDGLGLLRKVPFEEEGYLTLSEIFRTLLDKVGHGLDIRLYSDWAEDGIVGSLIPDLIRFPVEFFRRVDEEISYFDVLEQFLKRFNYQLFLSDVGDGGDCRWTIIQRSVRGGTPAYFDIPSGSGVTTTGTQLLTRTLLSSEIMKTSKKSFIEGVKNAILKVSSETNEEIIQNREFLAVDSDTPLIDKWVIEGTDISITGSISAPTVTMNGLGTSIRQRFLLLFYDSVPTIDVTITGFITTYSTVTAGLDVYNLGRLKARDMVTGEVYYMNDSTLAWSTSDTKLNNSRNILAGSTNYAFTLTMNGITGGANFPGSPNTYIELELFYEDSLNSNVESITFESVSVTRSPETSLISAIVQTASTSMNNEEDFSEELMISDALALGSAHPVYFLEYYNGTRWVPASDWDLSGSTKSLNELWVRQIISMFSKNLLNYEFDTRLSKGLRPNDTLVYESRNLPVYAIQYNLRDGFVRVNCCELRNDSVNSTSFRTLIS